MVMQVRSMNEFRIQLIKKHEIGKDLSEEKQKEVSIKIKKFFSIVHGDKTEDLKKAISGIIGSEPLEQIIYELIQNAYDENGDSLLVYYDDEHILFVNNGNPFNYDNIRAICNRDQSTKTRDFKIDQIGQFGKGFKTSYYLLGGDKPLDDEYNQYSRAVYEILKNYEGHVVFSWDEQKHISDFLNFIGNPSIDLLKTKSWNDENLPVLFKLILTSVPVGLGEKLWFNEGDHKEVFTIDEIKKLSKFINEINESEDGLKLKDMLKSEFTKGSLFFIKLNQKSKLEDMIASIDKGYYLMKSSNGQADSTSEFMFGVVQGYEIKNGKLGKAIKDTTISGVAFDLLKTVSMISDDMKWGCGGMCGKKQMIPVGMGGPAIKCKVNIGGK